MKINDVQKRLIVYTHYKGIDSLDSLYEKVESIHNVDGEINYDTIVENVELHHTVRLLTDKVVSHMYGEFTVGELVEKGIFVKHLLNPEGSFYSHTNYFDPTKFKQHEDKIHKVTDRGRKLYFAYDEGYEGIVHVEWDNAPENCYNIFSTGNDSTLMSEPKLKDEILLRVMSPKEIEELP